MAIDAGQVDEKIQVKRYKLQQPLSAYTFPTETPRIHQVRFDDTHLHVDLVDGRSLSIPLLWIPTLHHAEPAEREKYEINRSRTGLIWDPDQCAINEELFIQDYLGPYPKRDG
jgi:hypothetical protein